MNVTDITKTSVSKKVIVGKFGRPFGVLGFIHVNSFTEPPENILSYKNWYVEKYNVWQPINIIKSRLNGTNVIVQPLDCTTRDRAATYTNCNISIDRTDLPPANNHEYYWSDLEELTVINKDGSTLGKVDYLFKTPANDIMVVKSLVAPKSEPILIPCLRDYILSIDLDARRIMVDWDA